MAAPLFPPTKWAQRAEYIFLTVDVQDARDVKIDIQECGQRLVFSCVAPQTAGAAAAASPADTATTVGYALNLELFRPVAAEESRHVVRPRHVELKLKKNYTPGEDQDEDEETLNREWPRLTKAKVKLPQLTVDWAKWKDDDDDGDEKDIGLADFGLGGDGGESGINYEDVMRQFMVKEGQSDAEQYAGIEGGGVIPSFGSAAGQQSMEGQAGVGKEEEADDDDMPPLEEDA